ncbi:MAG TPA: hypothetical protein VGQ59_04790 [Cyclobacteriaceae bacterium]|jgi:hypothetical protein|nr:hypothetical protein [Cyclobacteriaceae bacterium]
MAPHTNSNGLKYELNILEHDSDYYKHSKVRVIRNANSRKVVPFKALINIILMAIVSAVAIAVIVVSVVKAI